MVRFATACALQRRDGAVLFRRRPDTGLLAGLIELPTGAWSADAATATAPDGLPAAGLTPLPGSVRHLFTHIDLTVTVLRGTAQSGEGLWVPPRGSTRSPCRR
ncbi:MAG: NUDIX domain-containing protein [Geminicoccaceae bacterium]